MIDTKNLREPAIVDDTGLRSGRLRVGGAASRGSAARMKELIQRDTGLSVWVQGVVAVWGELVGGTCERDKVLYVAGGRLTEIAVEPQGELLLKGKTLPVNVYALQLDSVVAGTTPTH